MDFFVLVRMLIISLKWVWLILIFTLAWRYKMFKLITILISFSQGTVLWSISLDIMSETSVSYDGIFLGVHAV